MKQTVYNFSAGPATLPHSVLEQAQNELLDYKGNGVSVMEISHRGAIFMDILHRAEQSLRDLLNIPNNYKVLFLQGGASTQFSMLMLNLTRGFDTVDAVISGNWSQIAAAQMGKLLPTKIHIAASNESQHFLSVPPISNWQPSHNAAFLHFASNETVHGLQYHILPSQVAEAPLISDMSSDILSREINVADFGVIYAGAQKNIGPAGATIVIIREDLLDRAHADIPDVWCYKSHSAKDGMYNTPATYSIYMAGLVFDWIKQQGGVTAMQKINAKKADLLYQTIDQSSGFYKNNIDVASRSQMNVIFHTASPKLDELFVKEASKSNLKTLKGYKLLGGMRASIYNAMPLQGVETLCQFMHEFARKNS